MIRVRLAGGLQSSIQGRLFSSSAGNLPVTPKTARESWACQWHLQSAKNRTNIPLEAINAPTTLPIDVDTTRNPSVSTFRHYLNLGKGFVRLYKSGIANVWRDRRNRKELMAKYKISNSHALTQYILDRSFAQSIERSKDGDPRPEPAVPQEDHITRSEYQLILRNGPDFLKLPFFAVIFAIFFETTPLLVLLFPRITPSTCVLPYQTKKDIARANSAIKDLEKFRKEEPSLQDLAASVHRLSKDELHALGNVFLYNRLVPAKLVPASILRNLITRHLDRVNADNILLSRFGSVWTLNDDEVVRACIARAIPTVNKTQTQMRADLLLWMSNYMQGRYDAGFYFHQLSTDAEEAGDMMKMVDSE